MLSIELLPVPLHSVASPAPTRLASIEASMPADFRTQAVAGQPGAWWSSCLVLSPPSEVTGFAVASSHLVLSRPIGAAAAMRYVQEMQCNTARGGRRDEAVLKVRQTAAVAEQMESGGRGM